MTKSAPFLFYIILLFSTFPIAFAQEQDDDGDDYTVQLENWKQKRKETDSLNQSRRAAREQARGYYKEGNRLSKAKRWNEAISIYHKAITADSSYQKVYVNLGVAYRRTGEINRAMVYYDLAIHLPNGNTNITAKAVQYKVWLLSDVKNYSLAIETCNDFLKNNAVDPEISYIKAKLLKDQLNRTDEAVAILEQIVNHHSAHAASVYELSNYYNEAKEPEQTLRLINQAGNIEEEKWKYGILFERAEALRLLNRTEEALADYRKAANDKRWKESAEYWIGVLQPK